MNTLPKVASRATIAAILSCVFAASCTARELPIRTVDDVIRKWTADQHLYVKGEIGIGRDQLDGLEAWLDQNGPHWTVVLIHSAADETYRAHDGRFFEGMDAVEYALGHGLANQTTFGELENPATGEKDGAVFVLSLVDRNLSYYSSDAQDRRGFGQSHWIGELDREAVRAMRNGSRILDAVKNTVELINGKVERAIAAEAIERQQAAEAEALAAEERTRAIAELRQHITDIESNSITAISASAEKMRANYPGADGDLTQPPIDDWQQRLSSAANDLTEDNVRTTEQQVQSVVEEINRNLDAYGAHDLFDPMVAPVTARAEQIGTGLNRVAAPMRDEALSLLADAKIAHSAGKSDFADLIRKANEALDRGESAISVEQERQRLAAARHRLIRNTALVSALLTAIALSILLMFLNRRRTPAFKRAKQALADREKSVEAEMDKVYKLIGRSSEILGSKEKIAARGYAGTTRELSDRTLEDVDDLLVMSTEVERVMGEARDLIKPKNPLQKVSNMFSGTRYERGINRITGEPLTFTRDKGLPLVIRRESPPQEANVAGEAADEDSQQPESISMTFEDVFAAFHERSVSAAETLDVIEGSLLDVNDRLAELQARINHASDLDKQLAAATTNDGYFHVPAFFEQAIPSAQADYDAADALCSSDPVGALQEHIPSGWRKITESLAVAESINKARDETFPKYNQCSPKLKEFGYDIKWMEQAVFELGERAETLFADVVRGSIAEKATTFSQDVTALGERAERSVEFAVQLQDETSHTIEALREAVNSARQNVGTALKIADSATLHEHHRDPDTNIETAMELLSAARAALQHGGVEAATRSISVLSDEVAQGRAIVDDTLSAVGTFEAELRSRHGDFDAVRAKVPRHRELVAAAEQSFAASALVLRAADADANANMTAAQLFADCNDLLDRASRAINEASAIHQQGKVLEAASLFSKAAQLTDEADHQLDDVAKHCDLLESRSRENLAGLAKMVDRTKKMADQVKDSRTQRATTLRFEIVVRNIQFAQHDIEASTTNRDPFRDATTLSELAKDLDLVDSLLAADRNAHAEAVRAVNGAKSQLRTAESLVQESRTDQLPDSATVQSCQREINSLGKSLQSTEHRLNAPHDDWQSVNSDATRINAELGVSAARLRDELQMAQQSAEALKLAAQEVFDATRWTGGYGIRITGSHGSQELERARRALSSGDYSQMLQLSRAAMMAARVAIQTAQREVARREREAAHAAEAERRRAATRRAASSGSISGRGGGFGGLGSGRSSGSWSGSVGRSGGSSSSGSGFSRSGW